MKTVINENQRGFKFVNGKFTKMLTAGKYITFGNTHIETLGIDQGVISASCTLNTLLENHELAKAVAVIEVADRQLALHYVDGKFCGILKSGKFAFWNALGKHDFTVVDISAPEVDKDIPEYIFSKIPQMYYTKVEVAEYQKARLYFNMKLVRILEAGTYNVVRNHARVITTSSGIHKIPIVASHGSAAWMEEEDAYTESDDTFGQVNLDAHKVGTLIKVSEELLQDSAFDLENYMAEEFARRIGDKEEDAFLNGNGSNKPTGILNATGGAQVGVTTASSSAITADELIDLYHSLKAPYRENAIWILNDTTVKAIRKLKDGNGQYLWQAGVKDGEVNTILGKPYFSCEFMPEIAAGAKTIVFGNLYYYWIGDRQGISFKRLNELYAGNGQIGFLASKRLDGKLVLPEAIKVLQMKA